MRERNMKGGEYIKGVSVMLLFNGRHLFSGKPKNPAIDKTN